MGRHKQQVMQNELGKINCCVEKTEHNSQQ